jgi:hypothetical protein
VERVRGASRITGLARIARLWQGDFSSLLEAIAFRLC